MSSNKFSLIKLLKLTHLLISGVFNYCHARLLSHSLLHEDKSIKHQQKAAKGYSIGKKVGKEYEDKNQNVMDEREYE